MTEVDERVEGHRAMVGLALEASLKIRIICEEYINSLGARDSELLERFCLHFHRFVTDLSERLETAQTGQTLSKLKELNAMLEELEKTLSREPFNKDTIQKSRLVEEIEKLKSIFHLFFSLCENCPPNIGTSTVYDVPPIVKIYLLVAVLVISNQIDKGIDFVMLCLTKLVLFILLILVSYHTSDYLIKVSKTEGIWPFICKMWNYERKWEAICWPWRVGRRLWTGPQTE
jgi:hypothetical protein